MEGKRQGAKGGGEWATDGCDRRGGFVWKFGTLGGRGEERRRRREGREGGAKKTGEGGFVCAGA